MSAFPKIEPRGSIWYFFRNCQTCYDLFQSNTFWDVVRWTEFQYIFWGLQPSFFYFSQISFNFYLSSESRHRLLISIAISRYFCTFMNKKTPECYSEVLKIWLARGRGGGNWKIKHWKFFVVSKSLKFSYDYCFKCSTSMFPVFSGSTQLCFHFWIFNCFLVEFILYFLPLDIFVFEFTIVFVALSRIGIWMFNCTCWF